MAGGIHSTSPESLLYLERVSGLGEKEAPSRAAQAPALATIPSPKRTAILPSGKSVAGAICWRPSFLVMGFHAFSLALVLGASLLTSSFYSVAAGDVSVGVCWGRNAWQPPPPAVVVQLLKARICLAELLMGPNFAQRPVYLIVPRMGAFVLSPFPLATATESSLKTGFTQNARPAL